ncbi:tyrosyl-tRNA synthetase [Chryseobacterium sp. SORGH_AS 447]|uniref:tyrosine--tRNA ligase n=1 Tax=Chryseobacterium sp. SORGH_AS_0447 TaxID=3041769 RepID=UPI00277D1F48|nr:tyrosine--tRNA ligase [Chryseobacterium sp. SORGH_AS_0447]MDQ1160953.1 tyrosyl-tRNA synthetase [Chryseobacterium sp. SORGH_AS_0447]
MIRTLQENAEIILPKNGLEEKLRQAEKENRKLIIKLGFDPTAPDLHLGHAVVLKKLRQFQELGHQVVIVVGSFTARIGDPTGKNKARKPLTAEEVKHNAETYIRQLSKVIDVEKSKIVFNSDWLDALPFSEVIQLMSKVTVAQLMHRNDFNKRFTENTPIAMHELVYPILQGFDSVQIGSDIEMGGTDQLFNCTMGRQLQESHGNPPQIVMCMPLLKGLEGKEKMSKSLNNTIGLTDGPHEMFGKTMSIPDSLIDEFIDLTTDFPPIEKENIKLSAQNGENPMNIKKRIARNIIAQYHNEESAEQAEQFFMNQFQNKNFDEKVFEPVLISSLHHHRPMTLAVLCHQLKNNESKSFIRRLILNGGVQVNNEKLTDPDEEIELIVGKKIKIGKRSFFELL